MTHREQLESLISEGPEGYGLRMWRPVSQPDRDPKNDSIWHAEWCSRIVALAALVVSEPSEAPHEHRWTYAGFAAAPGGRAATRQRCDPLSGGCGAERLVT